MYDWKKPLYQSTVDAMRDMDISSFRRIAEYFRLLGNYKDSAALYERCLLFPRKFYDTVMEELRTARSQVELNTVERKINDLKKAVGKETFQNEEWQDRQKTFEALFRKKEWKVFLIENQKAALLAGVVAFLALAALISGIYRNVHPGFLVFRGDQAFKNGNYSAAVTYYEEAEEENRDYRRDGDFLEKLDKAREYAGKESMEAGNLSDAVSYLTDAGTDDTAEKEKKEMEELFKSIKPAKIVKEIGDHNPVMTQRFGADPYALVYDGRVYLYMTGDDPMYDADGKLKENNYVAFLIKSKGRNRRIFKW